MADTARELIEREARTASEKYGPFTSAHEALGVLLEEFTELTAAVRGHSLKLVLREAAQVAAVALRLAEHCEAGSDKFKERSQLW